jgi:hypothetical protein
MSRERKNEYNEIKRIYILLVLIMPITYRTKEQRINEVKPIIQKLSELKIKASEHEEIRDLLQKIQVYIHQGERIEINIPFPIADVDIVGVLATDVKERVYMKFTKN